jgi:hypothetical protein
MPAKPRASHGGKVPAQILLKILGLLKVCRHQGQKFWLFFFLFFLHFSKTRGHLWNLETIVKILELLKKFGPMPLFIFSTHKQCKY